jgi:predicted alpha/beta hydrolase family esterase
MAKKKNRIVIVHGSYGSPEENWFPWLAAQLRKDGHNVVVPKFPTPEGQNFSNWREVFLTEVGPIHSDMVLVGHSAGPGFILKMLQDAGEPAKGVFLVSAFVGVLGLKDFDPINEALFGGEFDWSRIRKNLDFVCVINSDNDPYVPIEKGEEVADNLGVELTVIQNGGHLNSSAGFKEFPQLLHDIRSFLADANHL